MQLPAPDAGESAALCPRRRRRFLRLLGGCSNSSAFAAAQNQPPPPPPQHRDTFKPDEIIGAGHKFFGTVSRGLAEVVQTAFSRWGEPNGYVLGQEGSGAFVVGLRYGDGKLYTKNAGDRRVFWEGPSVGFDTGGEGARTLRLDPVAAVRGHGQASTGEALRVRREGRGREVVRGAVREVAGRVHPDQVDTARAIAHAHTPEAVLRCVEAVLRCREAIAANVAPQLACEAMALTLREAAA